ncbi:MAG: ARPP-1 family domain-containing protein [Bacteroidia bacterium]
MKTLSTIIISCLLTIAATAQYNLKNLFIETEENSKACAYKNLAIYPVHAKQTFKEVNKNLGKYLPLKKALEQKKVKITEAERGETVNTLFIQNFSKDTVIIIGGEVVQGGKQDRMISQDIIIPPNSKKINLSVFCVEHGRWTYHDGKEKSFRGSSTIPNTEVRKAAMIKKDQSQVWDRVSDVTSKNAAESSTGTYSAMDSSSAYKKDIGGYKSVFTALLKDKTDVIGFVAVSGDKILGCDMFATVDLFRNQFDNLISSYSTEAITNGSKPVVAYSKVKSYLDNILADESKQERLIEHNGTQLKNNDSKLHITVY